MDQQNPNDPLGDIGSGTTGSIGSGGTSSGAGYASGGTGTGMSSGGGMTTGSGGTTGGGTTGGGTTGTGTTGTGTRTTGPTSNSEIGGTGVNEASDAQYCTHCGQSLGASGESKGLEQFLGRLGISGDMFNNLKGSVDIDEYLNTAREYLKGGTTKVTSYTKENPAKVAAGVAALALGAGLIYAAVNRGKGDDDEVLVVTETTGTTGTVGGTGTTTGTGYDASRGGAGYDANRGGTGFDPNRGPGYDPNRGSGGVG